MVTHSKHSCLENLMNRGAWPGIVHKGCRVRQDWSDLACMSILISQFILPFLLWYPYICSLCLCLYFCFVNKIVYTNFFRFHIYVFSSVTQSTLCYPMDCSTPGLPVHHQLLESTQTHVHWVGDAIQPSHPLPSPSPLAFNLAQHQGLFKWVSSSHQVTKVLEFQL